MKGIRGFYLLNASLRRLGLREVPKLPAETPTRSMEDIVRLAFSLIDPDLFPPPSWMLTVEEVEFRKVEHARMIADSHREHVEALDEAELKIAYLAGQATSIGSLNSLAASVRCESPHVRSYFFQQFPIPSTDRR